LKDLAIGVDRRRVRPPLLRLDAAPFQRQAMRVLPRLGGKIQVLRSIARPTSRTLSRIDTSAM
jgi:hypothetical protein